MAWNKRYRVPFQSFTGTQYMVYIYEQTVGELVTLTGSDNPFETQEDQSDDIFTPIRSQTGYLRIIDETGGNLLEQLMPSNNTEKLVRVYAGTWNVDTFTDVNLVWQGFLCAEVFTQPWDGSKKMLEFPVKSVLAAMEDVTLTESNIGTRTRIAGYIVNAFTALDVQPSEVVCISNLDDVAYDMLSIFVSPETFFSEEQVNNQGDTYFEHVGKSYAEVLSSIASLYGMMLREFDGKLYVVMYDNGRGKIGLARIPWLTMQSIAAGSQTTITMLGVPEVNVLDAIDFCGDKNLASFMQGWKSATVTLGIGGLPFGISLPPTSETDDAPIEFECHNGKLYVQPHGPRDLVEDFYYYEYSRDTLIGGSDYATMVQKTLINGYSSNPYASADTHLFTGAFPCRWFYQTETERVVLKNGLYFNTQYQTSANSGINPQRNSLYTISSPIELDAFDGWLRVDFKLHNLVWFGNGTGSDTYYFDDANQAIGADVNSEVYLALRVGDKWWNRTQNAWVDGETSSPQFDNFFFVNVKNDTINTNKTEDMNIDEDDGFFIPVTESLIGDVSLYMMNYIPVSTGNPPAYRYCYTHILTDLEVTHIRPISITASSRGSNNYRKDILLSGFSEAKEVKLSVGTMNNNLPSPCFIKRDATTYAEGARYYMEQNVTLDERQEMNLLERMVVHYGQVRRAFTAQNRYTYNPLATYKMPEMRYVYDSRKFFGVEANRKWRDDIQEVKFIEVT